MVRVNFCNLIEQIGKFFVKSTQKQILSKMRRFHGIFVKIPWLEWKTTNFEIFSLIVGFTKFHINKSSLFLTWFVFLLNSHKITDNSRIKISFSTFSFKVKLYKTETFVYFDFSVSVLMNTESTKMRQAFNYSFMIYVLNTKNPFETLMTNHSSAERARQPKAASRV